MMVMMIMRNDHLVFKHVYIYAWRDRRVIITIHDSKKNSTDNYHIKQTE